MLTDRRQLAQLEPEPPTAAASVPAPSGPPATADLIPRVSALRYRADMVNSSAASLSRDVYMLNLSERTSEAQRMSVRSLLTGLSREGVSWSVLSRLLGVTVPAIRKWRLGEGGTLPENRQALARLLALVAMLSEQFLIEDAISWLEMPLAPGRVTLADGYAAGRVDLILDYAAGWISVESMLDELDPNWRESEALIEHELFEAPDGLPAIRAKPR